MANPHNTPIEERQIEALESIAESLRLLVLKAAVELEEKYSDNWSQILDAAADTTAVSAMTNDGDVPIGMTRTDEEREVARANAWGRVNQGADVLSTFKATWPQLTDFVLSLTPSSKGGKKRGR